MDVVNRGSTTVLKGPCPSQLIVVDGGVSELPTVGRAVNSIVLANMIMNPREETLLGVCLSLPRSEMLDWYRASVKVLGNRLVQLEGLRFEDESAKPRGEQLVIRWSRSPFEVYQVGQLTEPSWLIKPGSPLRSDGEPSPDGTVAFAVFNLDELLRTEEMTFPQDLLVDEVIDLRGSGRDPAELIL